MSVLSDEQIEAASEVAGRNYRRHMASVRSQTIQPADCYEWHFAHAVADAAIAADRAARAEQSARLQAMGMSAGAASDYVEFVSHRQHCAIRHGLDACTCDYAKAAAPVPSQDNGGAA